MSTKIIKQRFGPFISLGMKFGLININDRPLASKILIEHLRQTNYPYWSAFFIPYRSIINDQFGFTYFNFNIDNHNYHILRLGCWPYIKYHCDRKNYDENIILLDKFFTLLKLLQLGIPSILYGFSGYLWAKHYRLIKINSSNNKNDNEYVRIYFWYPENYDSPY